MNGEIRVVWSVAPLALDSIFPTPGRNDTCHCGSGRKYKRCHEPIDQAAWRIASVKSRQADAVGAMLRTMPSNRPEYDLSRIGGH